MLCLLSPAKSFNEKCTASICDKPVSFETEVQELVRELKKKSSTDLMELCGISEKLGVLNHKRYSDFDFPLSQQNRYRCLDYFHGDVYKSMNRAEWSKEDYVYAGEHLRILSGLYGLLNPMDQILPYRLEMGTKFGIGSNKNLYEFWDGKLAQLLNGQLEAHQSKFVINLASNEYVKAVPKKKLDFPMIQVDFKSIKNGKPKTIGILAKRARGSMTSWIVRNRIDCPEGLKEFHEDNYTFDISLSSQNNYVFVRNES
jgi:cytoplasmic iron level regulating protein YaaA (DUF328/UPF0246 family)